MKSHFENLKAVAIAVVLVVGGASSVRAAPVTFDDGGVHDIDDASHFNALVSNNTTVNINATGVVGNDVALSDTSIANFLGGTATRDLLLNDNSVATVTNGTIGNNIEVRDSSHLEFISGSVGDDIQARGSSTSNILDVDISIGDGIGAEVNALVNVYGGSFGVILAEEIGGLGDPVLNWFGGTLLDSVVAKGTGVVNIFGSDFNFPLGPLADQSGTLTGTLFDGTPINNSFLREAEGTINLITPIPSAAWMGLTMMAGLLLRRDRRAV